MVRIAGFILYVHNKNYQLNWIVIKKFKSLLFENKTRNILFLTYIKLVSFEMSSSLGIFKLRMKCFK
jgi:hypothetical protein